MAKNNVKHEPITKTDWQAKFTLIGTPKISEFTFKIDEQSSKNSTYIFNKMRLGVDCGDCGIVYCDMMGGYDASNPYALRKVSKDDPSKMVNINWEDRLEDDAVDSVADFAKISVALKLNKDGKPVYEYFLHEYDAIAHIKDYLTDKSVVRVSGRLVWSMYNNKARVTKQVNRITLVVADNPKIGASFTQSILLDKDSIDTANIDYKTNAAFLSTRVLDYAKMIDDADVSGQYPYPYTFELRAPSQNALNAILNRYCKVKKNITQINFNGMILEGGAKEKPTYDDLPDDVKQDIKDEITTEEEALAEYAAVTRSGGNVETRMILLKPAMIQDENGQGRAVYPDRYTEDDLSFDWLDQDSEEAVQSSTAVDSVAVSDDDDFSFLFNNN